MLRQLSIRTLAHIAFGLVLFALPAGASAEHTASGGVQGVVSGPSGPLAGASVGLSGASETRSSQTDSQGRYAFMGLEPGTYTVKAKHQGHRTGTASARVKSGSMARVDLRLQQKGVAKEEAEELNPAEPKRKPDSKASPPPAAAMAESSSLGSRGGGVGGGGLALGDVGGVGTARTTSVRRKSASGKGSMGRASRRARPSRPLGIPRADPTSNTEAYENYGINKWTEAAKDKLSTFAVDVDTASYTIVRRKLNEGGLPPKAAVRVEEIVNYFKYDYAAPTNEEFAVHLEAAPSPFSPELTLLRVGLKGREIDAADRAPVHLTFLVDTSGSMNRPDKMGLVKRSLRYLVDNLSEGDTVALATYAGSVREVLRPTGMDRRADVHNAIENLMAGGSTAMSSGLQLAYQLAAARRQPGHVNRIIVCSDGDANVGRTDHGSMLDSVAVYANEGITLSTIGFGMGNYQDTKMEQLANKGDGNYYYIDSLSQAKRVFGQDLLGTLSVIARDVKLQVEFDPRAVERYRLVGYENRDIADVDFRNDKVDAGEIGSGHTVTALYEVEVKDFSTNWATVRTRWKLPFAEGGQKNDAAEEKAFPVSEGVLRTSFAQTSPSYRRAVAAAAWAENLRQSPFTDSWDMASARKLAENSLDRESPEELELISLIDRTHELMLTARR